MCKTETRTPPPPSTTPGGSTPTGGGTQPCHPTCTLASQTVATSPANRARTTIGVGEEVTLTVTGNPATWTKSGGGTLSPNTGTRTSVTFTADDNAGSITITATGSGCSCVNTIAFTIVQPANWTMKRQSGTNLKHTSGRPDCGWTGNEYIHPNDVNFYRIEVRELDSQPVRTGSYLAAPWTTPIWHGGYPLPDQAGPWLTAGNHTDADGTKINMIDDIYSGDAGAAATGNAPPFTVGTMYFPITFQWHIVGNSTNHNFSVVRQEHEIFSTGKCESRKGSHTEFSMYNDPTSTP